MAVNFEFRPRDVRVTSARVVFAFTGRANPAQTTFQVRYGPPAIYSLLILVPSAPPAISSAFSLARIPNSFKISSVCSPVGSGGRPGASANFHGYVLDRRGWGRGASSEASSPASEGDRTGTVHESVPFVCQVKSRVRAVSGIHDRPLTMKDLRPMVSCVRTEAVDQELT